MNNWDENYLADLHHFREQEMQQHYEYEKEREKIIADWEEQLRWHENEINKLQQKIESLC